MAEKAEKFTLVGTGSVSAQEKIEKPALSFLQDAWRRLKKNKLAVISMWFLILLAVFSLASAAFLSQEDANRFDTDNVSTYENLPPNSGLGLPGWNGVFQFPGSDTASNVYEDQGVPEGKTFLLGTDKLGRSVGKRIIVGIRISLFVAIAAALIDLVIGVIYGLISGYAGGKADIIMQRVIEVIASVPNLIIVTMLGMLLGNGIVSIILSIGLVGWTSMARQVRNMTLSYKEREFVLAAKALGASPVTIAFKHILPNISGVIIVQMMMTIPAAIMYEAVLSAINLGVKPPTASLGSLISDAQENFQYYPYQIILPSLALVFISLAFILLGDGLRDAFDPKSSQD